MLRSSIACSTKQSEASERSAKDLALVPHPQDDLVDRDVDQLHEEADEAHDEETNAGRDDDLLELCERGGAEGARTGGERVMMEISSGGGGPRNHAAAPARDAPFASGFVHIRTRWIESFANFVIGVMIIACTSAILELSKRSD